MVKKYIPSLCLICLLLYTGRLTAQNSSLVFEHYGKLQGLPDKTTTALYQDSRNFLWIGTEHGLVRFDGKFFKHYNQIGEGGISDRIITCITEDAAGNIWFGTESGLNKLNPYSNTITQFNEGQGPGTIPFHWCNSLFTDTKKQLWLTTEKGIALYNSTNNSFTNYPVTVWGKDEKINKFINQVVQDKENNLWLSTSYGIKKFNTETKQYQSFHKAEAAAAGENVYYGICTGDSGTVWAITFGGQLFRYHAAAGNFERVFTAPDKQMRFAGICSFSNTKSSALLIATSNGLLQLNPANLQQAPLHMLQGSNLTKLFAGSQQNLWVASTSGLYRYNGGSPAVQWQNIPASGNPFVYHFIPVTGQPQAFFLTTTDGWYRYNSSTQKITPHGLPADERALLKNINRFAADENGYWFTSVNGFGYYHVTNNRLTDLTALVENKSGQAVTGYIISPVKNQLWLTVRRTGIMVYNTVTQKDTLLFGDKEKPGNVFGKGISDLQLGTDNHVWFIAGGKLYRVNPATLAYSIYSTAGNGTYNNKTEPYHLLFTTDGRTIVNSLSAIYELKNEKLELIFPAKGLFNFSLYSLQEDSTGTVWAVTDDGLYKTNKQFSTWKNMNSYPGLENEQPGFEINLSQPGKILLGSAGRIGIVNTHLLQQSSIPLPVIISRMRLGEDEKFIIAPAAVYRCNFKDAVEIELAAPDFNNEKENKLLYRLEGWDKEWKVLVNQNIIRYGQLPSGDYTFSTKSVNAEGRESAATTVSFRVIPPFYRSWWFITALLLLAATVLFVLYRYKIRKALELEKMRTRIASDLHDDIGATLSSISMYSEAIKKQVKEKLPHLEPVLDKMGENSRDMVTGMSDIVWAINPDNDTGGKLLQRMENYATDICAAKEITLQFAADEKLKHLQLAPEQRKNIYLIFKEAMNNAVKYADAKNIQVTLHYLQKQLTVTIKDDGCGFDFGTIQKGNGLNNMQLRAAELNGQLLVHTTPEGGTVITLTVTV